MRCAAVALVAALLIAPAPAGAFFWPWQQPRTHRIVRHKSVRSVPRQVNCDQVNQIMQSLAPRGATDHRLEQAMREMSDAEKAVIIRCQQQRLPF